MLQIISLLLKHLLGYLASSGFVRLGVCVCVRAVGLNGTSQLPYLFGEAVFFALLE